MIKELNNKIIENNIIKPIFYGVCLILAAICFYFSISENLFYWFFGDELGADGIYKFTNGFWACTKYYYVNTSINRLTALLGTCAVAKINHIFSMPLMGWILGRLVYFFLVPFSIALFFKEIIKIPLKLGISISMFLFAIIYFAIEHTEIFLNMYIICLAIYAASTITFFALLATFKKSINNNNYFMFFCLCFAMNLNAHEIFLIISGCFIPLFAWYKYKNQNFIIQNKISFLRFTLTCKAVWILLFIYMCSAFADILAPGVTIRQKIWPSSGTFQDGIGYAIISIVNIINIIFNLKVLTMTTLILGVTTGIYNMHKKFDSCYYSIYTIMFFAPLGYILITGFLLGITPTLFMNLPDNSADNQIIQATLNFIGNFVTNKGILETRFAGGLAFRQLLFPFTFIFVNIFMIGYHLSRWICQYIKNIMNINISSSWPIKLSLIISLLTFSCFHPYGVNSLRILHAFFYPNEIKLTDDSIEQNLIKYPQISIFDFLSNSNNNKYTSKIFLDSDTFKLKENKYYESSIINIGVNNYLKKHRRSYIDVKTFKLVYKLMDALHIHEHWWPQIYDVYKVQPEKNDFQQ